MNNPPAAPPKKAFTVGFWRTLFQLLRPYRTATIGAGVALVVAAGAVLTIGAILRAVIDRGLAARDPSIFDHSLVVMLCVVLVLAMATYGRFSLVTWLGERVVADLRNKMHAHLLSLDMGYFETARSGDILARLTNDLSVIQTVVGSSLSMAARNLLLLIGGVVMLAITSLKLTGLVLLVVPFVVAPIVFFGKRVRSLSRASQEKVSDLSAAAEETIYGIHGVQAYTQEAPTQARFGQLVEESVAVAIKRIRARAALTALVICLAFAAICFVLWTGGHDVLQGRISAGDLTSFIFYSVLIASSTGAISEVMGDLQRAAGALDQVMDLLAVQSKISAPTLPLPLPEPAQGMVSFRDVTFHYPSRPETAALQSFSLDIKSGEKIALVGPSGAGKTTVLQLLQRFYDPQSGMILFDGVNIKNCTPQNLREHIGLVPQDPTILSANAWDNIGFGRRHASREDIVAAADAAHARDFIEALPQGFDTYLGEKGVRLSGGQKQRIAIARAILRNPALLLLDEATSALDAESEKLVQDALARLMQGRTTIMIAHRLATVVNADRIAVIEGGKLVALDSHQNLLTSNPLYARLAELQFAA